MLHTVRRRRAATVLIAAAAVTASVLTVPTGADAAPGRYYTIDRTCASATTGAHCFALQRVRAASANTPGAQRVDEAAPALASGPAGGFTPKVLAKAYGVNSAAATKQVVGIVDAYDDPNALDDLNVFDDHYGLPAETSTSFRKVSQRGKTTDLPAADTTGWSTEISLDLDAVRGLCAKCRIILVEADSNSFEDLAAATNMAVKLGATEVSNSYGGTETDPSDPATPATAAAYNHPGVVITASTGDDGYYDWDYANYRYAASAPPAGTQTDSSNAPELPSAYNTVVAVGGTSLQINDDGTRSGESVWNTNGLSDNTGYYAGAPQGASGGGCSTVYPAQKWQRSVAGYNRTACGTKRLAGDVAALADPYTGFDIYDSYEIDGVYQCRGTGDARCWATFGGTSLASPIISALWALAGGAGGVRYPALSLYGHLATSKTSQYDVTVGGNGACGGQSAANCASAFGGSPNLLGNGQLDCAWDADGNLAAGTRACTAATGYDGPSGVGAPRGLTMFKPMAPTARITVPSSITHGKAAKFGGTKSTDPFPGGTITTYRWNFGDKATSTSSAPSHVYAKKGSYTVTLAVTDSYARSAKVTAKVTVK